MSDLDPRGYLHAKCDCVPDLGPEHCHLCSVSGPVPWDQCSAVREVVAVETAALRTVVDAAAHLISESVYDADPVAMHLLGLVLKSLEAGSDNV